LALLAALFLTPLFHRLPEATLAAVVIVSVSHLVRFDQMARLWKLRRIDFLGAAAALVGVLTLGLLRGLFVAVVLSVFLVVRQATRPFLAELGRRSETLGFVDIQRDPTAERVPGLLVLRPSEGIFFGNASGLEDAIAKRVEQSTGLRAVLLDLGFTANIDVPGADMLAYLHKNLAERGLRLRLAGVTAELGDMLRATGTLDRIGREAVHHLLLDGLTDFLNQERSDPRSEWQLIRDGLTRVRRIVDESESHITWSLPRKPEPSASSSSSLEPRRTPAPRSLSMIPEATRAPDGLWLALLLDGSGGARELGWDAINAWDPGQGKLWLHLDPADARVSQWLRSQPELSPSELEHLLRQGRRPFFQPFGHDGFMLALRGLAPELNETTGDLTSLRMWVTPERTVSLAERYLPNLRRLHALFRNRKGPRDLTQLHLAMSSILIDALHDAAMDLEDPMAGIEFLTQENDSTPNLELWRIGQRVTRLRQHVAPLRIVLARMVADPRRWLIRHHLDAWRHLIDELHDTDEMLQLLHERAGAVREDIWGRMVRRTNYVLYVLTLISAVLLPLTLVTSLFGMNVGIHGGSYRWMDSTFAFIAICVGLVLLAWGQYRFIRRRHLI
jgi:Mg2+ and Co2+ transporter CorA/anti-anti-sigma regulatory factor